MRSGSRFALALVTCFWIGAATVDSGVAHADEMAAEVRASLRSIDVEGRRSALAKLMERVESETRRADEAQRFAAARSILDPLRPDLVEATRDPDDGVRALSAMLLAWVSPDGVVIDALLALLEHPVWDVRATALGSLVVVGSDSPRARSAVVALLDPTEQRQFTAAASVVARWRAAEAVPALKKGLVSNEIDVKRSAAKALGALEAAGRQALPALRAEVFVARQAQRQYDELATEIEGAISRIEGAKREEGAKGDVGPSRPSK